MKKTCCVYSAHGIIMGKASLDPWLADFLWEEIANVIAWTRHLKANKVKPDPDGRFNDDGSNFRSRNSDKEDAVQLILVRIMGARISSACANTRRAGIVHQKRCG